MTMIALLSLALAADGGDVLQVVTSAPPVGYELTPEVAPGEGVHLVAATREFQPFVVRVDEDRVYASSTEDVYRALAELLPATGLDRVLANLVAIAEDVEGDDDARIWRFEQQVEGVPVVGAGLAVVTEAGSVRRVEGALFLDRGAANAPHLGPDAAAERAVEAIQGGAVSNVLPYVLPVGGDLRHTWFVEVETDVGGYEVGVDAETGEVLQLVVPQLGLGTGRFGSGSGLTRYGIIIGNGVLLAGSPSPVRLTGVSLVDGRLVRR